MKRSLFIIICILFICEVTRAQKEDSCYTDIDALITDDYKTLDIFEYEDGGIWFVTEKGISIYKEGSFETINKKSNLIKNPIGAVLKDSKNRVWVGTGAPDPEIFTDGIATAPLYKGGFVMYDGTEWHTFRTNDLGIDAPLVTQIYETSSGDIWFVVRSSVRFNDALSIGGLIRFSEGEWTSYKNDDFPCYKCKNVDGLQEDKNGRLWIWSDGTVFYYEDGAFGTISKEDGFKAKGTLSAVFMDSKHNLWLGSGGRIGRYDGTSWQTYSTKEGAPPMLYLPLAFVEMPDATLVMIAQNGLYVYEASDRWKRYKFDSVTFNGKAEEFQFSYGFDSKGDLWVAHRKNIVKFDGKELLQFKKNLESNLIIDAADRVWAPTRKGMEIYEKGQWTLKKEMGNVFGILNYQGEFWVLTKRNGVWRVSDNQWEHISEGNGLPSNRVNMGYVSDDGSVWISTTKGLCRF